MVKLDGLPNTPHMRKVLPVVINNRAELDAFEEKCLSEGFEGIMIRTPNSPYKCGRSTEREGYLLKIKRFEDSEAVITGFTEKFHNANEAKKDAFGRTERSSHQENMIPMNTLGNLLVRDVHNGVEFELGSGFDDVTRKTIWDNQQKHKGMIVKYKFQPIGVKDKPRFPVFLGFRSPDDME
jgi:DNA ligase-1